MKHLLVTLLFIALVLAACGGSNPTPAPAAVASTATPVPATATPIPPTATPVPPTATPVPATATPAPPTATPASRCQPAPAILLDSIAEGLTVTGGGGLSNGWTVRSADYEQAYFVAAEITGEGMGGSIGLWITNDPASPGMLFSVNAFAKEFSQWPDGGNTDAAFSQSDDGAREALDCAGQ